VVEERRFSPRVSLQGHPQFFETGNEKQFRKAGPPSITVPALSRDTCSGEGFFGFDFPSWEVLILVLLLFLLMRPRLAFRESCSGTRFH